MEINKVLVPDEILATIFKHNLDYATYARVCKHWYNVLKKFPSLVWDSKMRKCLQQLGCPTIVTTNVKFPQLLLKLIPLNILLDWMYSSYLNTHATAICLLVAKSTIYKIWISETSWRISYGKYSYDFRTDGNCVHLYDEKTGKLLTVYNYSACQGQYIWDGPVKNFGVTLLPHGSGDATVNGQVYSNVLTIYGVLYNEDDFPDMTRNLKRGKIN